MKTVFVAEETKHNIGPARDYGKLIVMVTFDVKRKGNDHAYMCMKNIMEKHDIQPDDYILCIGDPLIIGLAIHLALLKNERVQVLKWDKVHYCYKIDTIEL